MKRTFLNLAIAGLSTLAVVGLVVKDVQRSSPGELSAVHGTVEALQGSSGCSECHGDGETSRAAACLECHTTIADHLAEGRGLHSTFAKNVRQACNLCHSEHHGAAFAMVNARTFLLAGVQDPKAFDHTVVGFDLGGAHTELTCTECHTQAEVTPLPEGTHRFVGLQQDCAACHEDPHRGVMVEACASCHNQSDFHTFVGYEHPGALQLLGAHAEVACSTCHEPGSAHAVEAVGSRSGKPEVRDCAGCHENPHSSPFLAGVADLIVAKAGEQGCAVCHKEGDTSFAEQRASLTPALHAASGFSLQTPHADLDCAQCHGEVVLPFAERFPGRDAQQCKNCHEDPHGGQFDSGPFAEAGCVACHGTQAFAPHGFNASLHALSAFALEGAHRDVACEACHVPPQDHEPRRFAGLDTACAACHTDVHAGAFQGESCATCHDSATFAGAHARGFDHGRFTGFALRGAHEAGRCEACHKPPEAKGPGDRALGRIADVFGKVEGCASCHRDPHRGNFGVSGSVPAEGCAACHDEVSFRLAVESFDHSHWTGFALDGNHGTLDCSACHTPLLVPDALGRTWNRAKGPRCADCHNDPHAGQFGTPAEADCAKCHGTGAAFAQPHFDHDRDSRFALDATHRVLDCAACHKRQGQDEASFIRYKPLGIQCADCHGQSRKELNRPKGKR